MIFYPAQFQSISWQRFSGIGILQNHSWIIVFADTTTCDSLFCYNISTSPPPTLDWTITYAQDSDTHNIICGLRNHKATDWTSAELSSISPSYHSKLKEGTIVSWNQKLVYTKCIFPNKKYIALIIVPQKLRQRIFDHFHSGPSGAHMGEYKTFAFASDSSGLVSVKILNR